MDLLHCAEHHLDWLVSIHRIIEAVESLVEFEEAGLAVEPLEAGEDVWGFVVAESTSAEACYAGAARVVRIINYSFEE